MGIRIRAQRVNALNCHKVSVALELTSVLPDVPDPSSDSQYMIDTALKGICDDPVAGLLGGALYCFC